MNASVIDTSAVRIERAASSSTAIVPMPDATPMQVLAMAVQKGLPPQVLDQMMGLQERWEANQARKAFDAAMAEARAEIKPIVKRREVDFTTNRGRTNYKYEDLAQIAEEIDPILAKHGLSYRHRSKQDGKRLSVTCIVAHRDGHSEETTLAADNDESGNKNSIQAIGSAATYLQRYTLKLALGLSAAKDDDGRGGVDDPPPARAGSSVPPPPPPPVDPTVVSNGKHKGKKWSEISEQYLDWATAAESVPAALKAGANAERERRAQAFAAQIQGDESIPH